MTMEKPTKKDSLLFLKAEIDWHKEHLEKIKESGIYDEHQAFKVGFIAGLEHAYKTIKGLK